jgi:hypothetical protein
MSDRLMNGEKLERGQSLTSRNGACTARVPPRVGDEAWAQHNRPA